MDFISLSKAKGIELQRQLKKYGVDPLAGNPVHQFWKLSMDLLANSLEITAYSLISNLETMSGATMNDDEKKTKIEMFKSAIATISWDDNDITLSPTQFYNKFFAYCLSAGALANGKEKTGWRDIFERVGAVEQCYVAQQRINEFLNWNQCYICGTEIYDKNNPHPQKGIIHDTRECEHILPAFTSLGYKGLIQSSNLKQILTDSETLYFKYEYANAHRCCNQIKSEDKWIIYDSSTKTYVIDQETLSKTLTGIQSSNLYDCSSVKKETDFINNRGNSIINSFLDPISTIINQEKTEYGDLYDIKIRINQIAALNKTSEQLAYAILTGTGQPTPPKIKTFMIDDAIKQIKKQFTSDELLILFSEVYNDLFSKLGLESASGKIKRNQSAAIRSIYTDEYVNLGYNLEKQIIASLRESGIQEIDESELLETTGNQVATLKQQFRGRIVQYCIKSKFFTEDEISIFQQSESIDDAIDNNTITGEIAFPQTGGQIYNMYGGQEEQEDEQEQEELNQSYFQDIIDIAENDFGITEEDLYNNYGITSLDNLATTTQSGRVSKPPVKLFNGDPCKHYGFTIGNRLFCLDAKGEKVQEKTRNGQLINSVFPLSVENGRKGVYDNEDPPNFYSISGGRNKKSVRRRNGKKSVRRRNGKKHNKSIKK
jgi:hypothetical protein